MRSHRRCRRGLLPRVGGLRALAFAAAVAAAVLAWSPAEAARTVAPEKTTLRISALDAPTRFRLDHPLTVVVTVTNRGLKTVPRGSVRLSLGPVPDPGFKITWATAALRPLGPGSSRRFPFRVTISSRFDKSHADRVGGQIFSFYGVGNYVLEACAGRTPTSDEACRESRMIAAS
jgi:hypothetical protein